MDKPFHFRRARLDDLPRLHALTEASERETFATSIAAVAPARAPGGAIAVRSVASGDLAAIHVYFERLDEEGRRLRFHGATNGVPRAMLELFRDADQRVRITRVAVAGSTVLGEAVLVSRPGSADAEIALSVAANRRREGIGRRLLSSLVTAAARAGLDSVHADVLPENTAFIALAGAFGFAKRWHPEDPTMLRMTRKAATRDKTRGAFTAAVTGGSSGGVPVTRSPVTPAASASSYRTDARASAPP